MNSDTQSSKALAKFLKPIQRILIISFDRIARMVCEYHLREMGFNEIDHVTTAEEAITMGLEHYALVICDYYLGAGITGLDLLKSFRHRNIKPMPFLLMSEYTDEEKIHRAIRSGRVKQFIAKPISDRIFPRAIIQLLGEENLPDPTLGYINKGPKRKSRKKEVVLNTEAYTPSSIQYKTINGWNHWQEMIFDLTQGAGYSYSRIAYRIKVTPSTIQKLATKSTRRPRLKIFQDLLTLYMRVFQGPFATPEALEYWAKKDAGCFAKAVLVAGDPSLG